MVISLSILLLIFGCAWGQIDTGCDPSQLDDYRMALCIAPLFYEAQRSGVLPSDQRVTWRGDSALEDGADKGYDLVGGYYDAGDNMKFHLPLAFTITGLSWGFTAYSGGYSASGQTIIMQNTVKWGSDYLLKAHIGSSRIFAQVGDPEVDHAYWGRPEDMDMERPSFWIDEFGPGADLAGETCAAVAAAGVVFKNQDQAYGRECVAASRQLFEFADQYRGLYTETIDTADPYYPTSGYGDELAWAAVWMYKATEEQSYLDKANEFVEEFDLLSAEALAFDWDDKTPGVYALMAEHDGGANYRNRLADYLDDVMAYKTTPNGLIYISETGTLRSAMNVAFIATREGSAKYYDWAQTQLDYALSSTGRSFVIGYGENYPTRPRHASSSCPAPPAQCDWDAYDSPDPNPNILFGALVGGPDEDDTYVDDRTEGNYNEVAIDYNALFLGLISAMINH